jgi:hypothetical protein
MSFGVIGVGFVGLAMRQSITVVDELPVPEYVDLGAATPTSQVEPTLRLALREPDNV